MVSTSKQVTKDLTKLVPFNLHKILESKIQEIKEVAIESYENNLLGTVIPKGSLSDPTKFLDEYIEELDRFEYLKDNGSSGTTFSIPDVETFDFTNLGVVKLIIEGMAGNYKELPETDLNNLLSDKNISVMIKRKLRGLPDLFNGTASVKDRFTIVSIRGTLIKTLQAALNKNLVKFPFSNSPPLDLFEPVEEYVDSKMDKWIEEALNISTDKIKVLYR